jgi:pimeloyl-ACP methyl ester carboxylesterase
MDGGASLSKPFRDLLADRWRVDAVEYPTDEAPPMANLAERVAVEVDRSAEPVVLLGESYSGPVAISAAALHPVRLAGLILACTFVRPPLPSWMGPLIPSALFDRPPPRWAVRRWFLSHDAREESVDAVQATIRRNAEGVLAARVRQTLAVDLVGTLRSLPVPAFAIRASRDRMVRGAARPEVHVDLPHVTVDAPHLAIHAQPERCATVVAAHLEGWDR